MYKYNKVNQNIVQENIGNISTIAEKNPKIKLIYLFGSYATGEFSSMSDVDIALYVENLDNDIESDIYSEVTALLKTDEVDIVYLNKVRASFSNEIIKKGKLMYCRDEEFRVSFESRVLKEYLDFKPFQDFFSQQVLDRINNGGLGKSGYKVTKTNRINR